MSTTIDKVSALAYKYIFISSVLDAMNKLYLAFLIPQTPVFCAAYFKDLDSWKCEKYSIIKRYSWVLDDPHWMSEQVFQGGKYFMHVYLRNKCLSKKIADTHKIMTDTDKVSKLDAVWQLLAYLWKPVMGHKILSNFLQRKHRCR